MGLGCAGPGAGARAPLTRSEPDPVAPLLGHGPPLGEPVPLTAGAAGADAGAEAVSANQPLVGPRPPGVPRAGLGEPMRNLPPSSSSWDITTLSRAQQLRTRSLIQSQMASRALTGGPFRPDPPAMLGPGRVGRTRRPGGVGPGRSPAPPWPVRRSCPSNRL